MLPGAHRQEHQRAQGWAVYWYAWRGGPQIGVFRGATLAEAVAAEIKDFDAVALAWAAQCNTRPAVGQFGRVLADYLASDDYAGLKRATRATKGVWIDRLRTRFGAAAPAEITMDAVSAWLKDMEAAHGKRARDHAKSALSSVAAWGRAPERPKEGRLPATFRPTEDFKNAYHAPAQDAWTAAEIEKLPKAPVYVRNILLLALNAGLRRADLCRVSWTNVDWEGGVIRLVTSKGERKRRRIVITLTPALRKVLVDIGPERDGPILRHSGGGAWAPAGMGHAVNRELKALGVKGRLHGLRRSAATLMAKQGMSSRRIARVMGWSDADAEAMGAIYIDEEKA